MKYRQTGLLAEILDYHRVKKWIWIREFLFVAS